MNRLSVTELGLNGLKLIESHPLGDERGFLTRIFCAQELALAGWQKTISQINHTYTQKIGTVRGMHFQIPPFSEMKLVSCLRGQIWDVALDLRKDSPTFLKWHAEVLSSDNQKALLIPEGFAHGFQALSNDCELLYLHSAPYQPDAESAINPQDALVNIKWPLEISALSKRDASHPLLLNEFKGIEL